MVKPMDRPPFRFAVQATNAAGGREWRDTVRKVEDIGYSTLFLADHYLGPGPAQKVARTPRQDLAPIAAMAAAGAVRRQDASHRVSGVLHRLSRAGRVGQRSRDPGSAVGWAAGDGHRSGLE